LGEAETIRPPRAAWSPRAARPHLPAFRAALPKYLARAHLVADKELTRAGLQARRAAAQPSVRGIFQARE